MSGIVESAEDKASKKALKTLVNEKESLTDALQSSDVDETTKKALGTFLESKSTKDTDTNSIKIPWLEFRPNKIFPHKTKRVVMDNLSTSSFLIILGIVAFVSMLFKSMSSYIGNLAAAAFSQRAIRSLRIDLFNKFLSLHQGFYDKHKAGALISRSTADLAVMQTRIATITTGLIQHPLTAFVFLVYLMIFNYKLTLFVFISVPLIIGCIRLFGRKAKKHSIRVQDAIAELTSNYQEVLLCLKVVQGFCIGKSQSEKFQTLADKLYKKSMHWSRWNLGLGPMMDATVFLVLPAILLLGMGYFRHTLGELITMFYAFSRVYAPVRNLAHINNDLRTLQGATQRVFDILKTEPDIREKPNAIVLPKHRESVEFREVNFSYNPATPILRDVSFRINAGEIVAFVGSTGAGKSTMLDLIPRFYDVTGGSILIDGTDIRDVTLDSLRSQISIVSQEVLLFHDTIANNISFNSPAISMESIESAAKKAYAHDFIMAQPEKYNTIVGDRGTLLSGGQKQRIAIARAILADSSILLLDEVASALDAQSERVIQDAIDGLRGKHTIFVVAHRLSTVRTADRIFVLEDGRIVESGTFSALMEMNGRFRQLYSMQFQV
ncbi:MAG: ABC transporter ATP-binding protein [Deltaproteobacteria bacterium]|nr:ABC transporter ATP-binding protein [Deltaproteobacteria bacterium]